ncbi:MAG: bifunctional [glutamine synthetase] adenylyltransferase/[glutamine synthetase]-adenylyl-L-tyrosine phosphorylase [Xanthobacteraceae bacterium]|nr:bifunctional [glutamine synthetase] adenylyltransferase/[glutamine synthetase]-adenylyl-L-tyrosine phosphorylase [Xanthobacteraceae bacterium]QYK45825.1 MAG: bifunctional [glutamine synthetase] adenylyltransferase/[glutamine synthetase]-adenylyl-L-tyrosine phosphorylase [Xanthobacteraceae bacterium]
MTPTPAAEDGTAQGPLVSRIRETPRVANSSAAKKTLAALLQETQAKTRGPLEKLLGTNTKAPRLLEGIAEGSPYLWGLITAAPDVLLRLLREAPEQSLADILTAARDEMLAAEDDQAAQRALRRMKREGALLTALADIGGVWPLDDVTGALTKLADTAVQLAVDRLLRVAASAGKMKLPDADNPGKGSGYIVLAMGKHGAGELNYSSDIDLIVFYEKTAPLAEGVEPAPFFVSMTKSLLRLVHDRTEDGYVFRVDLRLRPDPGSTQAAISTDAGLDYYEREGQTWERAAYIKARPIAGDIEAGERFLKNLSPFVWRRYLDHAAIAEVHAMKRQIHAFRGHDEIAVVGHNIKLGRGGIREIEFFVQTQQLIAGGRVPALRGKRTLEMLAQLASEQWIDGATRDELNEAYQYLRRVEHRLQMIADEQTHVLPDDEAALERFALFLGAKDTAEFAKAITLRLQRVQGHYAHLFEDAPPLAAVLGKLEFPPERDDRETLDTLAKMGFKEPLAASHLIRQWMKGEYRALQTESSRAEFQAILPALLDALSRTGDADAALLACDQFLSRLPGGERLLAALRTHPDLLRLIATILGTSPRLRDMIAQAPSLLDGLLDPAFFATIPSEELLNRRLQDLLKQAASEEDFLDRTRSFGREQLVLIGVRILSGALSASQAGEAYATLADVIIRALHGEVMRRFAEAHGNIAKAETAVIALGKLGSREMTAGSDLDLMLLYEFDEGKPESDGKRPLYGAQYFARLTQRIINALTIPTNMGKLYDVDLRLRPSGRSGPVATSLSGFVSYQTGEAWTWEHMALTRARVISSSAPFKRKVEKAMLEVLRNERDPVTVARDVLEMRQAIATERGEGERWDIKNAAGGLIDVEFLAQFLVLVYAEQHPDLLDTRTARVIEAARKKNLLGKADGELLGEAVVLYHNLTQVLRLCVNGVLDPAKAPPGLLALLTRASGLPDFTTLNAHLAETQAAVRASFLRILNEAAEY